MEENKKRLTWPQRFVGHLKTIHHHKWLVMRMCFRVGLYRQGLLHDLSKYSLAELLPSIQYFEGTRSPYVREKQAKGYSLGWLHHKGRNKHHFEYWMDIINPQIGLVGVKMPKRYVAEMFIDRICASKNYLKENYRQGSALAYYNKGQHQYVIHPDTRFLLEYLLKMLADRGEEETMRFMKEILLKDIHSDYREENGKLILGN